MVLVSACAQNAKRDVMQGTQTANAYSLHSQLAPAATTFCISTNSYTHTDVYERVLEPRGSAYFLQPLPY